MQAFCHQICQQLIVPFLALREGTLAKMYIRRGRKEHFFSSGKFPHDVVKGTVGSWDVCPDFVPVNLRKMA